MELVVVSVISVCKIQQISTNGEKNNQNSNNTRITLQRCVVYILQLYANVNGDRVTIHRAKELDRDSKESDSNRITEKNEQNNGAHSNRNIHEQECVVALCKRPPLL